MRTFTAVMPSTLLIAIASAGTLICAVLAAVPVTADSLDGAAVAGGLLLAAACGADLLWSIRVWRRSPLGSHRGLPHALAIGMPAAVEVTLVNQGGSRWRGHYQEYADSTLSMPRLPLPFDVPPRQRERLGFEVTPTARGLRHFAAAGIRLRSRLGLLDLDVRIGAGESRRVFPIFEEEARFVWLAGDRRIQSTGLKSVRRRGAGTQFDQLVDYQAGDPIRHIDWKATEKHHRPIVRKFQDERDQEVTVLLDCGRRMRADDTQPGAGAAHFDHCLNAMMLLAFVALRQGDAVGAMTFGAPEGARRRFAPRKGREALNAMMAEFADVEASATFSDYEQIAAECLSQRRKRGLVVMITNSRDEDAPGLGAALALLRTRHAVVLANLREEVVARISGQELTTPQSALECAAALEYTQARERLLARLTLGGVRTVDCEPGRLGVELVKHYRALKGSGSI